MIVSNHVLYDVTVSHRAVFYRTFQHTSNSTTEFLISVCRFYDNTDNTLKVRQSCNNVNSHFLQQRLLDTVETPSEHYIHTKNYFYSTQKYMQADPLPPPRSSCQEQRDKSEINNSLQLRSQIALSYDLLSRPFQQVSANRNAVKRRVILHSTSNAFNNAHIP